jgi:hypothetical protein
MAELFMVFDVESIGLHGEGFDVGWVIVQRDGREVAAARRWCFPDAANGTQGGHDWVGQNWQQPHGNDWSNSETPRAVRAAFRDDWYRWVNQSGAVLAAEVSWPVEARFLLDCVRDTGGEWSGPYPLIDIASVRLAAGFDPVTTEPRLPNETPAHNPLADARQSARLLIEALNRLKG